MESNLMTMSDVEKAATAMSKSGYFQDAAQAAQAFVKILAGQEMGFGPFSSMTGVYIISGKPSVGANLMASAVKRSGRYDYRVVELDEKVCDLEFFQAGKSIGRSRFTLEDARKAGTKNLDKYARNMLFARAMSNGVKWFTPDVFNGAAVYTPEELGANVDGEGEVIELPVVSQKVIDVSPKEIPMLAEKPLTATLTLAEAVEVVNSKGIPYYQLESKDLSYMSAAIIKSLGKPDIKEPDRITNARKLNAIKLILEARAKDAPPVEPPTVDQMNDQLFGEQS
jgi:hypothetical protein